MMGIVLMEDRVDWQAANGSIKPALLYVWIIQTEWEWTLSTGQHTNYRLLLATTADNFKLAILNKKKTFWWNSINLDTNRMMLSSERSCIDRRQARHTNFSKYRKSAKFDFQPIDAIWLKTLLLSFKSAKNNKNSRKFQVFNQNIDRGLCFVYVYAALIRR